MRRKVLSFFAALIIGNACIGMAIASAYVTEGLRIEDPSALIPYVVFAAVLAAICVVIGGRLTRTRATVTGIVIGLLPSVILLTAGFLTMKGLEPWAAAWIGIPSGVGGGVGALLSSVIQQPR